MATKSLMKHYNVGQNAPEAAPTHVVSHRRKLPLKVIRKLQEHQDHLDRDCNRFKPTSYCGKCHELHSLSFMRLHEGGFNQEDEWWCLNCHRPIG